MTSPNIEKLYTLFKKYPQLTTDSRDCPINSMFFALKGDNFNGNKFAAEALKKGCAIAVIDEPEYQLDDRYVVVKNVLESLQKLANHHRKQFNIPVIGITGSNGKTTTKELISTVLCQKLNTHFTKGNLNNHIGVPLTLLQLNINHEIAVIEMGANHPYEIGELCRIAEPNYGIITNIGKAHLEGFGSFETVINTKKELYDFIRSVDGTVFLNASNTLLVNLSHGINAEVYGTDQDPVSLSKSASSPGLTLNYESGNKQITLNTHLTGNYNLENIQAAVKIGHYFNVPEEKIIKAIETYTPTNNRSQILKTKKNTLILDMYNANPSSMTAAVTEFLNADYKNKVAILGAMKELGIHSDKEHKSILDLFEKYDYYHLICIGKEFLKFNTKYPKFDFFPTTEVALKKIAEKPIVDSHILLKGSRSMNLEKLLVEL